MNRIFSFSRAELLKRYSLRYVKKNPRVKSLVISWTVEGETTPFQIFTVDVGGQAVGSEAHYAALRDPSKTWPVFGMTPPAVALEITGYNGTLFNPPGIDIEGPGPGLCRVITLHNMDVANPHTLRVVSDGKAYDYEVHPDGWIAFVLIETPPTDKITIMDRDSAGFFEGFSADPAFPDQVAVRNLKLKVEEKDATGATIGREEVTVTLVAADITNWP
jgi:hypothetical protein